MRPHRPGSHLRASAGGVRTVRRSMLKKMQLCIYQFCVVKPLVSLILAVLETVGVRQPGVIDAGSVFLSLVKATSLVISAHMMTQWVWAWTRRMPVSLTGTAAIVCTEWSGRARRHVGPLHVLPVLPSAAEELQHPVQIYNHQDCNLP